MKTVKSKVKSTAIKDSTPFVRQCINLWLAGSTLSEFSVADMYTDLLERHRALQGLDMSKAISNELIRLESRHKLVSRRGVRGIDGCGLGRPPRMYRKTKYKFKC